MLTKEINKYIQNSFRLPSKKKSQISRSLIQDWIDEDIDEVERYSVPKEILDSSRGLFDKSIHGDELMKMKTKTRNRLSLLQQARAIFLDFYALKGYSPSREDLTSRLIPNFTEVCISALNLKQNRTGIVGLTLSKQDFSIAVSKLLANFPKHLENWIDQRCRLRIITDLDRQFNEDKYNKYKDELVSTLRQEMDLARDEGRLKILNGRPGTGKSTKAANIAREYEKKSIVSLSNTICNMFAVKCPGIDRYSCTRARFQFKNGIYGCIVFDETSQFGLETLDLLISIMKNNHQADFIFMGDIDQIPTFLSSGSFLYSSIHTYPDCTENMTTQYRFMNNPKYRDLMEAVVKSEVPEDVRIESITEELLINTDCFVTGANETVNWLNKLCLFAKNPDLRGQLSTTTDKPDLAYALSHSSSASEIPLIASSTVNLKSRGEEYKLYVNTRFKLSHIINDQVVGYSFVLENLVDHSNVRVSSSQLNSYFVLGYAITVNKSQGLEWPRVCVYVSGKDMNLKNFNAMYVAVSRGMDVMILATDEKRSFTHQDLVNILHKRYTYENFFIDKNV